VTKFLNLDFHGTKFTVPKLSLSKVFEHQRDLLDATSYKVQSQVPRGNFMIFVKALETGIKVVVRFRNGGARSLLAKEFWREDLLSECLALQVPFSPFSRLIKALVIGVMKNSSSPSSIGQSILRRRLKCLESVDSSTSVCRQNSR
jgi:hypothetical protein